MHPYILRQKVTIFKDHAALKWMMNKVDLSGQHVRWQVILSEFDYKIKICPGSKNANADALLRIPKQLISASDINDEPDHFTLQTCVFIVDWLEDSWYRDIYLFLETLIVDGNLCE